MVKLKVAYNLVFKKESYLVQTGYIDSHINKWLKNPDGEYIPWLNYPVISFLNDKLDKNIVVFEYGSGFSSIFFAKRVKRVISIEYDEKWHSTVQTLVPENGQVHYVPLNDEYPSSIGKIMKNEKCNLILVDGRRRVECAIEAHKYLANDGVLIFDDSHRERYKSGIQFYLDRGYRSIVFQGLKPMGLEMDQSTILYKENNCLGI